MAITRPIVKQENDAIANIPADVSQRTLPLHLNWDSYCSALAVNRAWHQIFTNISWQQKISLKFSIDNQVLEKILKLAEPENKELFFKKLFSKLNYLSQLTLRNIANIYLNPEDHLSLLACCSDNLNLFKLIPLVEHGMWLEVALHARCNNIAKEIINQQKERYYNDLYLIRAGKINVRLAIECGSSASPLYDLDQAIKSGDLDAIINIRKPIPILALNYAARCGNITTFRCLLDSVKDVTPNNGTLEGAIKSGNKELILFLIKSYELRPTNGSLNHAVDTGDLELVKFLLESYKLEPTIKTIHCAALSGNIALLRYFINSPYNLKPDIDTLRNAVKSKNLLMVRFLLDSRNSFNLQPDQAVLHVAAGTGNINLVRYLLDPKNNFNLKADEFTLKEAIESGNVALVRLLVAPPYNLRPVEMMLYTCIAIGHYRMTSYLLDRNNKFNLSLVHISSDTNLALQLNLLRSEECITRASIALRFNQRDRIPQLLHEARYADARNFKKAVKFFVAHKKNLALNNETFEWLKSLDVVKEALVADTPHDENVELLKTLLINSMS